MSSREKMARSVRDDAQETLLDHCVYHLKIEFKDAEAKMVELNEQQALTANLSAALTGTTSDFDAAVEIAWELLYDALAPDVSKTSAPEDVSACLKDLATKDLELNDLSRQLELVHAGNTADGELVSALVEPDYATELLVLLVEIKEVRPPLLNRCKACANPLPAFFHALPHLWQGPSKLISLAAMLLPKLANLGVSVGTEVLKRIVAAAIRAVLTAHQRIAGGGQDFAALDEKAEQVEKELIALVNELVGLDGHPGCLPMEQLEAAIVHEVSTKKGNTVGQASVVIKASANVLSEYFGALREDSVERAMLRKVLLGDGDREGLVKKLAHALAEQACHFFLGKMQTEHETIVRAARQMATSRLKRVLLPRLKSVGLTWDDVKPALELIDTAEEMREAISNPEEFLQKLTSAASKPAKRIALQQLRKLLVPLLEKRGLTWQDVLPVLEKMDTIEELRDAIERPMAFLERLARAAAPAAKQLGRRVLIDKARVEALRTLKASMTAKKMLSKAGLTFEDLQPALELVDTIEELKEAVADPDKFLRKLMEATGPAAIRLAVAKLKPVLGPKLAEHGLEWDDIEPALELIDTVEELRAAAAKPEHLLRKLREAAEPAALKALIAELKSSPTFQEQLTALKITWEEVEPALELVDTVEELKAAVACPTTFLKKLVRAAGPAARRLALAQLERSPSFQKRLKELKVTWEDLEPALELVDTVEDLKAALADPEPLLQKLLSATGPAAMRLAVEKLKPELAQILAPQLQEHGLTWEEVAPILARFDTIDKVKAAVQNPEALFRDLLSAAGPLAKQLALAKLKPKLAKSLEQLQLRWEDVEPALQLVDTAAELQQALAAPGAFLRGLASASSPAAKRFAVATLKPKLTPLLDTRGVSWEDVVPALELIDTVDELRAVCAEPEAFLRRLVAAVTPAAEALAFAKAQQLLLDRLKAALAPRMTGWRLTWEELLLALQPVLLPSECALDAEAARKAQKEAIGKLQRWVQQPTSFVDELVEATSGSIALKIELAVPSVREKLKIELRRRGLQWEDAQPALERLGSVKQLKAVTSESDVLGKLMSLGGAAARCLSVAQLRPKLRAKLAQRSLEWADVQPALELAAELQPEQLGWAELRESRERGMQTKGSKLTEQQAAEAVLEKLENVVRDAEIESAEQEPAAKKLAVALLRPLLARRLQETRVAWEDAARALELCTLKMLREALAETDDLRRMAKLDSDWRSCEAAALRFGVARLRPIMTPHLERMGLGWEAARPVLEAVREKAELEQAMAEPAAFLSGLMPASTPAARRVVLSQLRPTLGPALCKEADLSWSDVLPALEMVKDIDQLREAAFEPKALIRSLETDDSPAARRLAAARLKAPLSTWLQQQELSWQQVLPAIELVESAFELREAKKDQSALTKSLLEGADKAAVRLAVARLEAGDGASGGKGGDGLSMSEWLADKGLTWDDAVPALVLVSVSTLREAAQNAAGRDKLIGELNGEGEAANELARAQLRIRLRPHLQRLGVSWSTLLPALLQRPASEVRAHLEELADDSATDGDEAERERLRTTADDLVSSLAQKIGATLEAVEQQPTSAEGKEFARMASEAAGLSSDAADGEGSEEPAKEHPARVEFKVAVKDLVKLVADRDPPLVDLGALLAVGFDPSALLTFLQGVAERVDDTAKDVFDAVQDHAVKIVTALLKVRLRVPARRHFSMRASVTLLPYASAAPFRRAGHAGRAVGDGGGCIAAGYASQASAARAVARVHLAERAGAATRPRGAWAQGGYAQPRAHLPLCARRRGAPPLGRARALRLC